MTRVRIAAFIIAAVMMAGCSSGGAVPSRDGALGASTSSATTQYAVTELPGLGGTVTSANSITNDNIVSGTANLSGDAIARAAMWRNGVPTDLKTLGGDNSAVAFTNHNSQSVVGIAETAQIDPLSETWSCTGFFATGIPTHHQCLGFVYRNGNMTPLSTLGGENGFAAGANDRGDVVGWAETPMHDTTCVLPQVRQFLAVRWNGPGNPTVLSPLGNDTASAATATNNRGQAVGISGRCDRAFGRFSALHMVLWNGVTPMSLGDIGGDSWNTPTAINDSGDVVGFVNLPNTNGKLRPHAFLWTQGAGLKDLGVLPGDSFSFATGINNRGQVVGFSFSATSSRAFVYQNGTMSDLNALAPNANLALIVANDIDDEGNIAGQGFDPVTQATPAFVALPTGGVPASVSRTTAARMQRVTLPPRVLDRIRHTWPL